MAPHRSTTTKGSDGARDTLAPVAWRTGGWTPGLPASLAGAAGWFRGAAWGRVATGSVTAAGVESSRRDWMVPVTRLASSATFQSRSEAAGSRRRRRVTSHATPRSTVLWIKYVRSHASRLEARALIWF